MEQAAGQTFHRESEICRKSAVDEHTSKHVTEHKATKYSRSVEENVEIFIFGITGIDTTLFYI